MNLTELLYHSDRFQGLEAADIKVLAHSFDVRRYADGHRFCTRPAQACAMHLLISGQLEITYWGGRRHHPLWTQRLGPGDFFGCHLEDRSDPARIEEVARGPVTVASLPHEACALLLHGHSPLTHRFQQVFHDCLHAQACNTEDRDAPHAVAMTGRIDTPRRRLTDLIA